MPSPLLAPHPRRLEPTSTTLDLRHGLALDLACDPAGIEAALDRLEAALPHPLGHASADAPCLRLEQVAPFEPGASHEGYRLAIEPDGIRLQASHAAGLSHGLSTLTQWARGASDPASLPGVRIEDSPALMQRAFMLDVSRSRVPTMEQLKCEIERLAELKLNQLQLYLEHTFAYEGHEEVWRGSSPFTPSEIREIDVFCAQRHIELVPNQNSFGHLHRWLELPRYRQLAECPEGLEHPFAEHPTPFSLCPLDAGSIALLEDLYAQLLPNFTSAQFHIGFDETMDLGTGRSRPRAEEVGIPTLYADFLEQVAELAAQPRT